MSKHSRLFSLDTIIPGASPHTRHLMQCWDLSYTILLTRYAGSHSSIRTACLVVFNNLITNYMYWFIFAGSDNFSLRTTLVAVATFNIHLFLRLFWGQSVPFVIQWLLWAVGTLFNFLLHNSFGSWHLLLIILLPWRSCLTYILKSVLYFWILIILHYWKAGSHSSITRRSSIML